MWEKISHTLLIALATLGVLFIVIMVWPESDDSKDDSSSLNNQNSHQTETVKEESEEDAGSGIFVEVSKEETESEPVTSQNGVAVNIPSSELSSETLSFKTVTLDNTTISQDIFSDYDITVVHVWGTFCSPCIAEMGEYAQLYRDLPENVNLIAVICDVYDGIDSNVSRANEILSDAGAEFTNLRTSDDLYGIISNFQYVPSSFFVDSEGHIIGELMDGAGISDTKNRLDGYLQ